MVLVDYNDSGSNLSAIYVFSSIFQKWIEQ